MSRATLILSNQAIRDRAKHWVDIAEDGTRVEFKRPKRTLPQNDRMWAMLTDIAGQVEWAHGKLTPDDWKLVFLDALDRETRVTFSLDGKGLVVLSQSSSDLSKEEMSDLIELMHKFGAEKGVVFGDYREKE